MCYCLGPGDKLNLRSYHPFIRDLPANVRKLLGPHFPHFSSLLLCALFFFLLGPPPPPPPQPPPRYQAVPVCINTKDLRLLWLSLPITLFPLTTDGNFLYSLYSISLGIVFSEWDYVGSIAGQAYPECEVLRYVQF